jgi:hypothetical protein
MTTREYVVTLHKFEDLESFYEDMETLGGDLCIPDRAVEVANRRPVSRNTHYYLTDQEANLVRQDPRVKAVELELTEAGYELAPTWIQTSTVWSKSNTVSADLKNWGILRCVEGAQRLNWGSDGTPNVAGTVNVTASAKYVDVVIVDGHMNPAHPEFAVNENGTGGTRVVQYNWLELAPTVTGFSSSTYVYTPYVDPTYPDFDLDGFPDRTINNDHGCHVAGIAVGNSFGWARDATIYNLSPYASAPSFNTAGYNAITHIDFLRVWHENKPINPVTGIKNPTISNHSYGVVSRATVSNITTVTYQGVVYSGPFTHAQLNNFGIANTGSNALVTVRSSAIEADLEDLADAGVIPIVAAGNSNAKIDLFSTNPAADFNNYFQVAGGSPVYYNRGSLGSANGVICVGAVGSSANEVRLDFSNSGPGIDVYAPGRLVMSAINSTIGVYSNDLRNASFNITKRSGTSMAAPQVAGVLACVAETWPTIKSTQALDYIAKTSKDNQLLDGTGGPADVTDLQGSPNRYLFFVKQRPDNGQVGPKFNLGSRPTSGLVYPRPKIFRYGR